MKEQCEVLKMRVESLTAMNAEFDGELKKKNALEVEMSLFTH